MLKTLLKVVFVAGLLAFLVKKGFISLEATQKAFSQVELIVPAFLFLFFGTLLGIVRWQLLLRAHGIVLSWARVAQLSFVGNFFNIALPGAVSGDFVKAFYIGKEAEGKRADAFGSILFDRVAGVSALALVSATAMILDYGSLAGTPLFAGIRLLLIASALGVVSFYTYLFLVQEKHDPLLLALKSIESRVPRVGSVVRIYLGLRHYHHHRWTVLQVLGISVLIHSMVAYSCLRFAHALGDAQITAFPVFVVAPLGLLVTAVPVMPAGIGTGHAAFSWLFHLLDSERGADIYSLYALLQLAVGALGGLVYLRFRSHQPKPVLA